MKNWAKTTCRLTETYSFFAECCSTMWCLLLYSLAVGGHVIQSTLHADEHVLDGVEFIHEALGLRVLPGRDGGEVLSPRRDNWGWSVWLRFKATLPCRLYPRRRPPTRTWPPWTAAGARGASEPSHFKDKRDVSPAFLTISAVSLPEENMKFQTSSSSRASGSM